MGSGSGGEGEEKKLKEIMKKEGQNDEWSRKGRDESGAKADGCAGKEGA